MLAKKRSAPLGLLALVVTSALAFTACSSSAPGEAAPTDDNSGGSAPEGVRTAQERVEAALAIPEFGLADAPKVDASAAAGSKIAVIPISSENPYATDIVASMEKIAKEYSVELDVFANQGQPNQWANGIDQAINNKVDAVMLLAGADPKLVVPQITRAREAGIEVIVTHLYQAGEEPPAEVRDLISGYTTAPFNEAASLLADYAIAKGDGNTRILYITSDEVGPAVGQKNSFLAESKELCPGCTVDVVNVPLTDWATKLSSETQSYLVANPDTEWVIPIYDSMAPNVIAGINQANRATDVKVASFNGTPAILQLIQEGTPMAADLGESVDWLGYSAMDCVFRVLATGTGLPGGDDKMPLRIFDSSNVDDTGTPPKAGLGYGDAYIEGYQTLWAG